MRGYNGVFVCALEKRVFQRQKHRVCILRYSKGDSPLNTKSQPLFEGRGDSAVLQKSDFTNRVFYRNDKVFCVMNKFPYTPGHFLIIPHTHIPSPELLDVEIWLQMQRIAQKGVALLKEFGAQGVNLGMNIERAEVRGFQSIYIYI